MPNKQKQLIKFKITFLIIITTCISISILELINITHLFHKSTIISAPSRPITQLPKQIAANNGDKIVSTPSSTIDHGNGEDKNGQIPKTGVPTDPSKWSYSSTRIIIVKLPTSGGKISSGDILAGSSTIAKVYFRLTDDEVGVISQGSANVIDGNFAVSISFTSHGNSGRLDVFNTENDGREINEVQIPVRY